MTGRQRINLYFTDTEDEQLYHAIANYAAKQKRSMSQAAKILIIKALKAEGVELSVIEPE